MSTGLGSDFGALQRANIFGGRIFPLPLCGCTSIAYNTDSILFLTMSFLETTETWETKVQAAEKEVEWELKVDHAEKVQERENEWDRKVSGRIDIRFRKMTVAG